MARKNVNDFVRDVAARGNQYATAQNADGTLKITKNGAVLHRVFYLGGVGTITDANPQGDKVLVIDPNNNVAIADASTYLNNLI